MHITTKGKIHVGFGFLTAVVIVFALLAFYFGALNSQANHSLSQCYQRMIQLQELKQLLNQADESKTNPIVFADSVYKTPLRKALLLSQTLQELANHQAKPQASLTELTSLLEQKLTLADKPVIAPKEKTNVRNFSPTISERIHPSREAMEDLLHTLYENEKGLLLSYQAQADQAQLRSLIFGIPALGTALLLAFFATGLFYYQKRSVIRLQHKKAILQDALTIARVGNWEYDLIKKRVSWSDHIFYFCGMQPSDPVPSYEDFLLKIHPEDRQKVEQALKKAVAQGVVDSTDTRILLPNGEIRWLQTNGKVHRNAAGRPTKLQATITDITELKLAEQKVLSLSSVLTGVLNSSLSSIIAFRSIRDTAGTIIDFECIAANQRALEFTQWTDEQMLGNRLLTLAPQHHKNGLFEAYCQVATTGTPFKKEIHYPIKGQFYWLQLIAVQLNDGITVTFDDISERKQTEGALRSSEASLLALIENTSDSIWSIDQHYRLTTVNSTFQQLVYQQTGQIVKIGEVLDYSIFPSTLIPFWKKCYERAFANEAFTIETPVHLANKLFTFEYSFNPIFNLAGQVEGVTTFGRDITRRKETETDLKVTLSRLSTLITNLQAGILLENEHRIISLVNQSFCDLFGIPVSADKLIGSNCEQSAEQSKHLFVDEERFLTGVNTLLLKKERVIGEELHLKNGTILERDYIPIFVDNRYSGHLWYYRDVSAIKQSQLEREGLQRLMESILDSSPSGILALQALKNEAEITEDFEVLMHNRAAGTILDKEPLEWTGKRLGTQYPFFVEPSFLDTYRHVIESGKPATFEREHPTEKGIQWLQFAAVKMNDGLVVTYSDISQRKQAEQLVITQKEFYESILNAIPSDLAVFDAQHRYLFTNPAAIANPEVRQWLVGKDDFEYCAYRNKSNDVAIKRRETFLKVLEKKKQFEFEDRVEAKNGTYSYHIRRLSPVFDADGSLRMVIGYGINITERKHVEEQLHAQQELLRRVINTSPGLIYIRNWDGKYVLANQAVADYYGTTADDLIGKSIYDLETDAQVAAQLIEHDRQIISPYLLQDAPTITVKEQRMLHRSTGEWHWYQTLNVPFIHPNGTLEVLGIATNITQLKEVEADLIQARELSYQSMKAKEMFLSNMSHEIRTPMNAVIGMTHLLLQENPRPDQAENLKLLRFSAENLLVLINDILDFSKIEAGKIVFESVDFSLPDVLNGIIQSHAYKAEEKKIGLQIEMASNVTPNLVGDPVRLGQILNNLVSNAVKFTERGGVTLQVHLKKETKTKVTLAFVVKDTGIGIAEDKLDAIFESFTQASSDTTRRFGGTGLGLAITKRLLELQGSAIEIESTLGEGTTFHFTLPLHKSKQRAIVSNRAFQPEQQRSLSHIHVLLVEDNKVNQLVASKFLKKWGIIPDYANNGLEALQQVQKVHYDLILMDLQMPEMDGYQATKAIRALKGAHFHKMPIIALTASAMLDVKDKVFQIGMTDYLSKPFNPNDLYEKIAKYAPAIPSSVPQDPATPTKPTDKETEDRRCQEVLHAYMQSPSSTTELIAKLNQLLSPTSNPATPSAPMTPVSDTHYTDLRYLREIAAGNLDDMREVIESFLITQREFSTALHEWLSSQNREHLSSSAHKFKSCVNLVGLEHIHQDLHQLEIKTKQNHEADPDELTRLCQTLQQICDASVKELAAELDKLT